MDIGVMLLTALSQLFQWIGELLMTIFIKWWLNWVRRRVAVAIIATDFKVSVVTGVDPLRLSLSFKLHNGSASVIRLKRLVIHLFCGGAPVGSVVGIISETPSINAGQSLKVYRGESKDISVGITPDTYLWSWLLPDSGYYLNSSSLEVSTSWGIINVPLEGRITSKVGQFKKQINEFLTRVRATLYCKQKEG